jgi:hypothetical protein
MVYKFLVYMKAHYKPEFTTQSVNLKTANRNTGNLISRSLLQLCFGVAVQEYTSFQLLREAHWCADVRAVQKRTA